jgi:hypothetical protein
MNSPFADRQQAGLDSDVARGVYSVASVDDEDAALGKCPCGDRWLLAAEEVVPLSGRWYDALVVRCAGCGRTKRGVFDISSFFEPPTLAWSRQSDRFLAAEAQDSTAQ